jgi:tetratricopeptide (TPR) repeat protein
MRKAQPKEAVGFYEKAVKLQPDSASFHYQLGQAYLRSGEREKAKEQFAEAAKRQAEARNKQAERLTGKLPGDSQPREPGAPNPMQPPQNNP